MLITLLNNPKTLPPVACRGGRGCAGTSWMDAQPQDGGLAAYKFRLLGPTVDAPCQAASQLAHGLVHFSKNFMISLNK